MAAELALSLELDVVVELAFRVLAREHLDLALEAGLVQGDRAFVGAKCRDDLRERRRIESHLGDLSEDRDVPNLVAQPRSITPRGARVRVELAMSAVGEGSVAPEASAANALEQTPEQVDVAAAFRSH